MEGLGVAGRSYIVSSQSSVGMKVEVVVLSGIAVGVRVERGHVSRLDIGGVVGVEFVQRTVGFLVFGRGSREGDWRVDGKGKGKEPERVKGIGGRRMHIMHQIKQEGR